MAVLNISHLRARARAESRRHREENRWLVLVYCGVIAVLSLGSGGLNLLLDSSIGQTGGLDGLGMRAVLQTVQEILYYVNFFFGPFWSAGFLYAMLSMVRGGSPRIGDLTAGFRRFLRVMGHMAFDYLTVFALTILSVNLALGLYAVSSWGAKFAEVMEPVLNDPNLFTASGAVNMELMPPEALRLLIPMLVLAVVIFLPAYLYLAMGFRMSLYLVVDRPISGTQAHVESLRLMRGHKWQLLKLDLRYWWYYLLGFVVSGVSYLDRILSGLGVELPLGAEAMYFISMGAYFLLSLGLSLWKKCEVDAAHILAYEAIAYPEQVSAEC